MIYLGHRGSDEHFILAHPMKAIMTHRCTVLVCVGLKRPDEDHDCTSICKCNVLS